MHEAEATRRIVELRRGHTDVEQYAVELEPLPHLIRARGEAREGRLEDADARIGAEARPRLGDGARVTIET